MENSKSCKIPYSEWESFQQLFIKRSKRKKRRERRPLYLKVSECKLYRKTWRTSKLLPVVKKFMVKKYHELVTCFTLNLDPAATVTFVFGNLHIQY